MVKITFNLNKALVFSKILVAFDGSKPSLDAVESAMDIGKKYNSSLIILHVLDSYKYPYLLSSIILAPTFGSEKFQKEKEEFDKLMKSLKDKYLSTEDNSTETEDNYVDTNNNTIQGDHFDSSQSLLKETKNADHKFETAIVEAETSAASTIVNYAESKNVDLLVIGSRGRTGLKKMLVGSTASEVLKYAHCPVLVVR
ncbi:universal stress protein [Candidatus Nitrosocosmicus franklandus]|uniref:Universal stress protein UspE n=1 Tax=Candidatus Nitrosocosmicus franklandianus TaxID=1798806 RepID=A0A484I5I5_9ARCH|nr:universal stress protein [Candidatus Nitrosocosmicus franklandus]VFJ12948.1 Universal stress protein UspE [Candidatus Nitrosocosmicus franklandus]